MHELASSAHNVGVNPQNPTNPKTDPVLHERVIAINLLGGPDGRTPPPIYVDQLGALINREHANVPLEVLGFTSRFDSTVVELTFDDFWRDPASAVGQYAVLVLADHVIRTSMFVTDSAAELTTRHA